MSAAGHSNWHQTTVGKTELATRPLRLNEAIALAGLFGIPVTQLIAPITLKAEDVQAELDTLEERWAKVQEQYRHAQAERDVAHTAAAQADQAAAAAANELGRFRARLDYLNSLRTVIAGEPIDPETYAKITATSIGGTGQGLTFVSALSDADVDIEKIADAVGHVNSSVTRTVYRHQIADTVSETATVMDRLYPAGDAK